MTVVMKLVPYFDKIEFIGMVANDETPDWQYLESFDLEAYNGRGSVKLTRDVKHAMRFPDHGVAMETWRQQSQTVPVRPDGKPNRPLTAYHATFEGIDDEHK